MNDFQATEEDKCFKTMWGRKEIHFSKGQQNTTTESVLK